MPKLRISNTENMSFNAIRENKILAKISEFTVIIDSLGYRNESLFKWFWSMDKMAATPIYGNDHF